VRLTITYAGFEGESDLLEALYKRGLQGEEVAPSLYRQPGLLMLWSHEPVAPWPPLLGVMPSRGGKIRTQQASGPCIVRDRRAPSLARLRLAGRWNRAERARHEGVGGTERGRG